MSLIVCRDRNPIYGCIESVLGHNVYIMEKNYSGLYLDFLASITNCNERGHKLFWSIYYDVN